MPEKLPSPTLEELLFDIEPRILLSLSTHLKTEREAMILQAQAAITEERIGPDITESLQLLVDQEERQFSYLTRAEQRKRAKTHHERLEELVGSVVLAHVWQEDNNRARRNRRKLPH